VYDWQLQWPPIEISDCEGIILRNHWVHPAAVVRRIDPVGEHPAHFRVVTWAGTSAERTLIGRYLTLDAADRAVRFIVPLDRGPRAPDAMWATHSQTVEGRAGR
jgi:hypothetical protein